MNNEVQLVDDQTKPVINQPISMTISPIIEKVISANMPIESVDKLLAMQERFEANEAKKAFNLALARFTSEIPTLFKDSKVGYSTRNGGNTNYKHITLGYVLSEINPVLAKHGLSLSWRTNQSQGKIQVTARVSHQAGHFEETSLHSDPDNSGGKNSIQAVGSAVTYLKRYTAMALLGLESSEDDDAQGYEETISQAQHQSQQSQVTQSQASQIQALESDMNNLIGLMREARSLGELEGLFINATRRAKQVNANNWMTVLVREKDQLKAQLESSQKQSA